MTTGAAAPSEAGRIDESLNRSVLIESVSPELDCGRSAVKRELGETFVVQADILKEGHDVLAAVVRYRHADDAEWRETPMRFVDNDRWGGTFILDRIGRFGYTIEAWRDAFASYRQDLAKRVQAEQDVEGELKEGQRLISQALDRASEVDYRRLREFAREVDESHPVDRRARAMLDEDLLEIMARHPDRSRSTTYDRVLEVQVDRVRARYAAWYEMFPRSQGTVPGRGATFDDCIARLPEIRAMGFDVVYLPPIHPIGHSHRKGPNNTLTAGPGDPGSPYAIGNEHGGHDAVHPELGTLDDFDRFVEAARAHDMEIALDFAIQCSPDHPYVREHPEWFYHRADGSIRYAENPPKKYQDIYPLNFESPHWPALWQEMKRIILFWIGHGVKTFRVDNPHTKPIAFWKWLIAEIQAAHPETVFLSEAFTRPKMMKALAKAGFTQSYSYFTWRNFKQEIVDYFTELTQTDVADYLRANLFTNTPDILPPILQEGGRPAFKMRFALATTLSSVYGIYNGFELCENTAIPGTEEYAHSEKYEYKVWDWERPGNIKDYITRINQIRRAHPALHEYENLRFHPSGDDNVVFYSKTSGDDTVLVAVNLDPYQPHRSTIEVPIHDLGIKPDEKYEVDELITDARYLWQGAEQMVYLDPAVEPAAIFALKKWKYVPYESPSY